jgi:amino acid transporter
MYSTPNYFSKTENHLHFLKVRLFRLFTVYQMAGKPGSGLLIQLEGGFVVAVVLDKSRASRPVHCREVAGGLKVVHQRLRHTIIIVIIIIFVVVVVVVVIIIIIISSSSSSNSSRSSSNTITIIIIIVVVVVIIAVFVVDSSTSSHDDDDDDDSSSYFSFFFCIH